GPTGWNDESASLSELEWEIDNIGSLFSGLRTKKLDLAAGTVRLFQDEYPNTLSETEIQYLELLKNKPAKEATDDDVEF
ncbi:hypothetical protein ACSLVQ_30145, partial [Klebsiella pneumoniae]|uniref:hypothetical protein n=1 Tax=Klebsiella pneumoniae TaxID=573 RepID=UPI003EE10012